MDATLIAFGFVKKGEGWFAYKQSRNGYTLLVVADDDDGWRIGAQCNLLSFDPDDWRPTSAETFPQWFERVLDEFERLTPNKFEDTRY